MTHKPEKVAVGGACCSKYEPTSPGPMNRVTGWREVRGVCIEYACCAICVDFETAKSSGLRQPVPLGRLKM